jgi:methionyl-tRNA formyltransferase
MRIVFAGTPDFAAAHLKSLIDSGMNIVGVFTQPDRPKGRGHKLVASPVKEVALSHNLPIYQPLSFKKEPNALEELKALNADIMVVVAYGILLPLEVLNTPKYGCINVHGSLLPRWRGAAPIQRSLWSGDEYTGITIMKISLELDSGDMLLKKDLKISNEDTSETLYQKLIPLGCEGLNEVLNDIETFYNNAQKQDEASVTYAAKISKEEAFLDFNESVKTLDRHIRAYIPWPYAYFTVDNLYLKVHKATILSNKEINTQDIGTIVNASKDGLDIACKDGIIRFNILQLPGKKPLEFKDILNSKKDIFTIGTKVNTISPEECIK